MNLLKLLTLSVLFFTFSAQADHRAESSHLLRQAMMQSNADYNVLKKKTNHEEFDRADQWSERDNSAIAINQKDLANSDYQDYKEIAGEFSFNERQVSSTKKNRQAK